MEGSHARVALVCDLGLGVLSQLCSRLTGGKPLAVSAGFGWMEEPCARCEG